MSRAVLPTYKKLSAFSLQLCRGDKDILGVIEFERNFGILLEEDAKNALAHPNDPRLEIEDAMVATLHMNGIELPDSFFQLPSLKNFHPKLPNTSQRNRRNNPACDVYLRGSTM